MSMSAIGTKRTFLVALHMSAFGGKADTDQPFLTDLNLWIHSQARQLSEAAGTRIDRLYLGPIVL